MLCTLYASDHAVRAALPPQQDMAEAMTPAKDTMPPEERNLVLSRIAKVAKRQGAWQLAAKKYTQVCHGFPDCSLRAA